MQSISKDPFKSRAAQAEGSGPWGRDLVHRALIGGCALVALASVSGCKSLLHSDEAIKAYEARSAMDEADGAKGSRAGVAAEPAAPATSRPQAGRDALAAPQPESTPLSASTKTKAPANETAQVVADARAAARARKTAQKAEKARLAQAKRAHSAQAGNDIYVGASGLKGRKLLQASVDQAFASLRTTGGFWNSPQRLTLPRSLAANGPNEALQRAINQLAYASALSMEPFLDEAAKEVPMKYGQEKFKGQMPVTDFVHRTLGSASVNTLQERIYAALAASRDPAVVQCLDGLDRSARAGLAAQIADAADAAMWQSVKSAEFALEATGRGKGA